LTHELLLGKLGLINQLLIGHLVERGLRLVKETRWYVELARSRVIKRVLIRDAVIHH
jgi:hypothetical protein